MKTNTNAFTTNFSHRLNAELDASPARLHDCMNPVLERAAAIADLMEVAFECDTANDLDKLWRAAQAIRFEILDAQAMLNAYVDGSRESSKNALEADMEGGRNEKA